MRWEYSTLTSHGLATMSELEYFGSEGWELAAAVQQPPDVVVYYFKRRVEDAEGGDHG